MDGTNIGLGTRTRDEQDLSLRHTTASIPDTSTRARGVKIEHPQICRALQHADRPMSCPECDKLHS